MEKVLRSIIFWSGLLFVCAIIGKTEGFFFGELPRSNPSCNNRTSNFRDIKVNIIQSTRAVLLPENQTIQAYAVLEWTLEGAEGVAIDGFAVHFLETANKRNVTFTNHPIAPTTSCISGPDHIWFKTSDVESCETNENVTTCDKDYCLCSVSNCSVIPSTLGCSGLPDLLRTDLLQTVPATVRRLEYPIDFQVLYEFEVTPYYRFFANAERKSKPVSESDCAGLLENTTESAAAAQALCCEQGIETIVAYNFTEYSPKPTFNKNANETTLNMTISWLPPIAETLEGFWVTITSVENVRILPEKAENLAQTYIGNPLPNVNSSCSAVAPPYKWSIEVYNLIPGHNYNLTVSAQYNDATLAQWCDSARCRAIYSFTAKEPGNLCLEEFGLCDADATCKPVRDPSTGRGATCECGTGLVGDGLNSEIGQGCANYDTCMNDIICSEFANCVDLPPPEDGANCTCKDGFYGDGRLSGSGCASTLTLALAIAVPITVVLIVVIILAVWYIIRRKNYLKKKRWQQFMVDTDNGILMAYRNPATGEKEKSCYEPTFGSKWEIDRQRIHFGKVLGRGNYGIVRLAWLTDPKKQHENGNASNGVARNGDYDPLAPDESHVNNDKTEDCENVVAVKNLQEGMRNPTNLESFLSEIGIMLNIGSHENIVKVFGCSTTEEPVYLITEYLRYGDLLHFLWDAREVSKGESDPIYKITELSLTTMSRHVARGLSYLQQIHFIHGDIAARNILVGEGGICKISDFGLANDVYRYGHLKGYKERYIPFRWVSPERMMSGQMPITSKSDVWSYGNLMYEMFTLGCSPHPEVQSTNELLGLLESGYRMKKPNTCNDQIYELMNKCWRWRASSRPTFAHLVKQLDNIIFQLQVRRERVNMATAVEELDREKYTTEILVAPKDYVNGSIAVVENDRVSQSRAM